MFCGVRFRHLEEVPVGHDSAHTTSLTSYGFVG